MNLEELKAKLAPVFCGNNILRGWLFGSRARGESTRHSDVDLLVVMDTEKRFLDRYDGLLPQVQEALEGNEVDLLIYNPEELERMRERPFVARALREGVLIYESVRQPA